MTRPAAWFCILLLCPALDAGEPLHKRIDALIEARAKGHQLSAPAEDAEFVRRVYLDFAGRIPTVAETRTFLADRKADKRAQLIDRLLASPEYARRMRDAFNVLLMERLGDSPEWLAWLENAFARNRPWDRLAREMLEGKGDGEARGATFWLVKRLENYGQNPVDYSGLTRDIGRLFLGVDLRCAECHDHLHIEDYKQRDFQGLYAFVRNAYLAGKPPRVAEKPTTGPVSFMSVFEKKPLTVGPKLFGLAEIALPTFGKGQEYLKAPNPRAGEPGVLKFSLLARLGESLPVPTNKAFNLNIVNRLWFLMMGRGLVHPLDLHHSGNPPSHPELLELLAREFVASKYDIKALLRELALTKTYQRSSRLPAGQTKVKPDLFLTALERPLSAEQLLASLLEATGEKASLKESDIAVHRGRFLTVFASAPREPEENFAPSLKSALFLLNDPAVLAWFSAKPGNLIDRLGKLKDEQVAEELYLSVLSRLPDAEEKATVSKYLAGFQGKRPRALGILAWALAASTEFRVNH